MTDHTGWEFDLDGQPHTVKLQVGDATETWRQLHLTEYQRRVEETEGPLFYMSQTEKLLVDDDIVAEWGGGVGPEERPFRVADRLANFSRKGRAFEELDLFVDGVLVSSL